MSNYCRYHCIAFGPVKHNRQHWINKTFKNFNHKDTADEFGLNELIHKDDILGYVVIEETKDRWKVVRRIGSQSGADLCKVFQHSLGRYSVRPFDQIVLCK